MIKGIMIDLDNTLYGYEVCNEYAKSELFGALSSDLKVSKDAVKKAFDSARKIIKEPLGNTASAHSRLLYIQKTLEILGAKNYIPKTLLYHDIFWQKYFEKMKLFDGVMEFLEFAKKSGMNLCIVTDLTAEIQMRKIVHLGIKGYIDYIVSSEEAGMDKPSPEVFLLALKKMSIPKENILMIGDDEKKDIEGAKALGFNVIKAYPEIFESGEIIQTIRNFG